MTKATAEGRRLRLEVEGIEEPFYIEPLPAKRGKYLTDEFIAAALAQRSIPQATQVFIECFGPSNYARATGVYVDEYDVDTGAYLGTWDDSPGRASVGRPDLEPGDGIKFLEREALEGEPEVEGEPIRQEECEALFLCAFYWQTVVGMEAVRDFIDGGEGTSGSLKAMALLQTRTGLSMTPSSRQRAMESGILQAAASSETSDTASSSGSVRVPADRKAPRWMRRGNDQPPQRRRHK